MCAEMFDRKDPNISHNLSQKDISVDNENDRIKESPDVIFECFQDEVS